ncbi:hypothetical protein [Staphylococcus haemolyticus]|uniref:hypothetical protein n=1 Tax=Staphylococcus haemolyticus TaxID=1283 RepID=UPI0011A8228A|nr:hypothetical protein [Staphylococcus haemolyticus]
MTKSQIFLNAWAIAKHAAKKFGGSSKEYFSEALKMAWKGLALREAEIEVPEWIVRKNVGNVYVVEKSVLSVSRETEKALLIKATGKFGEFSFWTPKSVCKFTNVTDYFTASVTVEDTMTKAMNNHANLVEEAKKLGIKGIRSNMKSSTLRKKIAEFKGEVA